MNLKFLRLFITFLAFFFCAHYVAATFLTWSGTNSMNWDTTTQNWTGTSTWSNSHPDSATFGTTGVGSVSITEPIVVGNIYANTAGYSISGSSLTLNNNPTIFNDANFTISSSLAGSNGFTKDGYGVLTLSGNNTYTGDTKINIGYYGGSGLVLTGTNNTGGTYTIGDASLLQVGSASTGFDSGSINTTGINSNGKLVYDLTATSIWDFPISGYYYNGGSFDVKNGKLILLGTDSNEGRVTIFPGATLQLGNGGTTGVLSPTYTDGGISNSGNLIFYHSTTSSMSYFSSITGNGTLEVMGGSLVLTADNLSGTTTINVGASLQIGSHGRSGNLGTSSPKVINNGTLINDRIDASSWGSDISGSGSLSLLVGSLTLTGSNSYTGTTTISSSGWLNAAGPNSLSGTDFVIDGRLNLNGYDAIIPSLYGTDSSAFITTSSGNVQLTIGSSNASTSYAGMIEDGAGKVSLNKAGMGTFSIAGFMGGGYSGTTTVSGGTLIIEGSCLSNYATIATGTILQFGNHNARGEFNLPTLENDGTLVYARTDTHSLSKVLSGPGALSIIDGKLVFLAENTYTGNTSITSGSSLQLGDSFISGTLGTSTSTVFDNGALTVENPADYNLSNYITGTGVLNASSPFPGKLFLTNSENDYTGGTNISNNASLSFVNGALGESGNISLGGNSTLAWYGTNTEDVSARFLPLDMWEQSRVNFDTNGNNVSFASPITGIGGIEKVGLGTLTLNARSLYNGPTQVDTGTLKIGTDNATARALTASSVMLLNADGTLDLNGHTDTVNALAGWGSVINSSTNPSLLILGYDFSGIYFGSELLAGTISDSNGVVSLSKVGTNNQHLTGNNTYTGFTNISGGELTIGDGVSTTSTIGTGDIVIGLGGTLTFSSLATQQLNNVSGSGILNINSGHIIFDNSVNTIGTLEVNSPAVANTNSSGGNMTVNTLYNQDGNLFDVSGGNLILTGGNLASGGSVQLTGGNLSLTPKAVSTTTPLIAGSLVTSGLIAHFDASVMALGNGDSVSSWTDLTGLGHDASLTSGTAIYNAGLYNGKGVVTFDSTGQTYFSLATPVSNIRSVFFVGRAGSRREGNGDSYSERFLLGSPDNTDFARGLLGEIWSLGNNEVNADWSPRTASTYVTNGITRVNGVVQASTQDPYTFMYNFPTLDITPMELSLLTTGAVSASQLGTSQFNSMFNYGVETPPLASWDGDMAEVLIYDRVLTDQEIAEVEYYLGNKWGIGIISIEDPNFVSDSALSVTGDSILDLSNTFSVAMNGGTIISSNKNLNIYTPIDELYTKVISGEGSLQKTGSAILTLTANNYYSGTTTISEGVLQIGDAGTSGTLGSGLVHNGSSLIFNRSDDFLVANNISGTGTVAQIGEGTTVFTNINSYTGTTTISSGVLQIGNGGTTGTLGVGTVINNSSLIFNRSDSLSVDDYISGAGSLQNIGTGIISLYSPAVYTGTTTVTQGQLSFLSLVPSSDNWNVAIRSKDSYGVITLPDYPDLTNKVINIQSSAADYNYSIGLVSWFGAASGTPILQLNGIPVVSGEVVNYTKITYFPSGSVNFTRLAAPGGGGGGSHRCYNGATNPPLCNNNVCANKATDYPSCTACAQGLAFYNGICGTCPEGTDVVSGYCMVSPKVTASSPACESVNLAWRDNSTFPAGGGSANRFVVYDYDKKYIGTFYPSIQNLGKMDNYLMTGVPSGQMGYYVSYASCSNPTCSNYNYEVFSDKATTTVSKCGITCPTDAVLINGVCTTIGVSVCQAGKTLINGICTNVIGECPAGTYLINGVCITGNTTCPAGTSMVNGLCTTIGNCSVGTTLVNGLCMTVGGNVCPAGKKLVDGVCVNVISECPAGNSLVNGLCTIGTTACPAGTSMVNGLCTTIGNCPSGSTLVNGLCSTNISCPNGFVKVNGVCSVTNACPSGTTLINGSCVVNNICPVGLSLINGICSIDTTTCPANKTLINGVCTTITNICNNGATNPPICDNICPNGATNYPTCTTVCINNSTNYPTCDNNVSGPITNPSNENTNGNNSKKSEGNTTGDIAVGENGIIYSIGSSAVIVGKSIIGMIPNTFTKGFTNLIPDSVTKATEATFATTKQVVNTKVGSVVSKTLSTIGVAATGGIAVTSLVVNPASLYELFFLPLRLWSLLMSALGLRKRNRPWGTVYDSITKQPLDPAYVVLQDGTGKEISTSTTDLDGRYGFLIGPGLYKILATKTNYVFPSQRLQGKTSDELYGDLYFGEALSITDNGGVIAKNIPLDPISFDWNEVAKKNMGVMRFYSKWDLVIKKITNWLFGVGIIVAVIAFASAPVLYNEIILGFYGLIAILRIFGVKPKYFGWVIDQATGFPLAYALIHIYSLDLEREYIKKVCDSSGRYYALVPPGKYTVTVDRQNSDGTYTPAFTTEAMTVKKGIINGVWKV